MEALFGLLFVAVVFWWLARRKKRQKPQVLSSSQAKAPKAEVRKPLTYTRPRAVQDPAPAQGTSMRFAEPGRVGELFSYGGPSSGKSYIHDGSFAVIDVETTGFSPGKGDRVIELAIARVDKNGRIEDEYATLLNPEGRDTGAVIIHGISNEAVRNAPLFSDVLADVLARLDGAVIVAHNAIFEERFIAAEFARAGMATPPLPALCSLWLGQQTFDTPNHKLGTLAQHAGIPLVDAHAALGDVRATAALLPLMLDRYEPTIGFGHDPARGLFDPYRLGAVNPMTRAASLRKGTDGWMHSLMSRLPISAGDVSDASAAEYLEALATALEDGKIVGDEAKALAKVAGRGGMGAEQVRGLNERFLEMMREAAFADQVLTTGELTELKRAADALAAPGYFDDLQATVTQTNVPAGQEADSATQAAKPRKCGHCRTPGHYRSKCPELN
ncbi:DNA polymerase III epsilon subunit-like protein [Arthrobacter sp. B2I5]|uniref:3'-5' exonuclease n=1 Tax=Arthrobacter sp. B2I5 TaxID=3042266 RepID=UPI00278879EB|nr:3'-5' exonuclease [Arthrobacter sp. B2I5]MDQ0826069.1 DNA polymerase III epsilon subunit-like protein [Arthrobacter sp. B2I5]